MLTLETFISLIAPHQCVECGTEGSLLCGLCFMEAFTPLPDCCYACSQLSLDSRVCASCRKRSSLRYVWVRTEYEGTAKKLVRTLKFERARQAADPIGKLMAEVLPYLPSRPVLVPLPTATSRVRQRGYDHAALIAREVASVRKLRCERLLARFGQTRQVGAKRARRQIQLAEAFYCPRSDRVLGREIVVIDDVVTTGASIEQAARVLKAAGAKSVSALVFARRQ